MSTVIFQGVRCVAEPEESVLVCLQRHGVAIPSSCHSGNCQSCLVRMVSDVAVPPAAQDGLTPELVASRHFMACQVMPVGDLEVAPAGEELSSTTAVVVAKQEIAQDILRLRLQPEPGFTWRAGQYVQVLRADGLTRPYSIASLVSDGSLDLHVRRRPGGGMSQWMYGGLAVGEQLRLRGPTGRCVYAVADLQQPLVLIATGAGAGPMAAVLREALAAGHTGPIVFVHAVRNPEHLYVDAEVNDIARRNNNVRVRAVVDQPLVPVMKELVPDPRGAKVVMWGSPEALMQLSTRLYIMGARLEDIVADPWVAAGE